MYRQALFSLTVLFFMMGFITCLNDILVPYLKEVFKLDYSKAALVQFCFFAAYGLTSIPASKVIGKVGYQKTMVYGFILTALGCLMFFPAVQYSTYALFLLALFVLASGIVMLQVAANPFVSILGPRESASSRLTMVQAFNSFGTFLAPFFGSYFILSKLNVSANDPSGLRYPYLFIAAVLGVIAIFLARLKFPKSEENYDGVSGSWLEWKGVLNEPHLLLGMLGIFCYVGAEVAIGSFLVNYVMDRIAMPETQAANMVALYWGGAMAGRFLGIYTLREFPPGKVLTVHSLLSIALILISINSFSMRAVYSIVLVGVCNSIMFPTIFTLAIRGMSEHRIQKASGLLSTAIIGGALIPVITGQLADAHGLRVAFLLPALCYGYIALFGVKSQKT